MKLIKVLTPLTVAALLAACSNGDELTTETIDVNFYGCSDVEVKLASGVNATRSSVESDANGLFNITGNDKLGIFMLATNKKNMNPTEDDINWTASGEDQWSVWIANDSAHAVINGAVTDIRWAKTGQKYYYPIGNWYSYRFYGYYPRVETINYADDQVSADFTGLDGTKDVIWGRSLGADPNGTADEQCRYSAQYFRKAGFSDKYPSLSLSHKMMRIQFYVQGVEDEDAEVGHKYDEANKMMVDTIEVLNVPTTAHLIIADRFTEGNNGKISYDWMNNLANIGILGTDDGDFDKAASQVNNDDLIAIGQPMLLPVLDADAAAVGITKYMVNVTLRNTADEVFKAERPLDLVAPNEFEAGKTYKVVLQIAGPKVVGMKATLAPWNPAADNAINPLIFN
jgi:hypothetical protein